MSALVVRKGTVQDLPVMLQLAAEKRRQYESYQPVFHRRASDAAAKAAQEQYFAELIMRDDIIVLVAETAGTVVGFATAEIHTAPAVYDPGGPAAIIDEYCVAVPELWDTVGRQLLEAVEAELRRRGVAVVVVVCSPRDIAKRASLINRGMSVATEWFAGPLS